MHSNRCQRWTNVGLASAGPISKKLSWQSTARSSNRVECNYHPMYRKEIDARNQYDPSNPNPMEPKPMANLKFSDILDRAADDIKPPPTLPQGPYLTILQGLPEQIESSKKKTPGLRFTHKIVAPLDGVDEDALALIEGGVVGKTVRNDLWTTPDSLFMLK